MLDHPTLYAPLPRSDELAASLAGAAATLARATAPVRQQDIRAVLAEMRLIRTGRNRHHAAGRKISAGAHAPCGSPGMHEYELEAELLYEFHAATARRPWPTTSWRRAPCLHIAALPSRRAVRDSDLVLIDAGCEIGSSPATSPGPFSERTLQRPQRAYDLTVAAQQAARVATTPRRTFNDGHEAVRDAGASMLDLKV